MLSTLLFQSHSPASPVPGLLLIAAIVGAVIDYRYKKAGGLKASSTDKTLFLAVVLVVLGLIIWLGSYNPDFAGELAVYLAVVLFFCWELGRWRMRRKHPLPAKTETEPSPSSPAEKANQTTTRDGLSLGWLGPTLVIGVVAFGAAVVYEVHAPSIGALFSKEGWYAIEYGVHYDQIHLDKRPHDCEYDASPLGNKYCHYEKHATVEKRGEQNTAVYITWVKKED